MRTRVCRGVRVWYRYEVRKSRLEAGHARRPIDGEPPPRPRRDLGGKCWVTVAEIETGRKLGVVATFSALGVRLG